MRQLATVATAVGLAAWVCLAQTPARTSAPAASGSATRAASGPARYTADRDVPHGNLISREYKSTLLHAVRHVLIYTPPGYEKGQARYPVLYLLGGKGDDETAWADHGRIATILDNMIADGAIRPMMVVMPDAKVPGPESLATAEQRARNTEAFARELLGEIVPNVDKAYRTAAGRDQRAIAGTWLGGEEALAIGLQKLGTFSQVAAINATMSGVDFADTFGKLPTELKAKENTIRLLRVYCSRDARSFGANSALHDYLAENKVPHQFESLDGRPNWNQARESLIAILPQLFAK